MLQTALDEVARALKMTGVRGVAPEVPPTLAAVLARVGGGQRGEFSFVDVDEWGVVTHKKHDDASGEVRWSINWWRVAASHYTVYAFASSPCFGGPAGQVVAFDREDAGSGWWVFPSLEWFLRAVAAELTRDEPHFDKGPRDWARSHRKLEVIAADDSPRRFQRLPHPWVRLANGEDTWAIREVCDGVVLRLGDLLRHREAADPRAELERRVGEMLADGYVKVSEHDFDD